MPAGPLWENMTSSINKLKYITRTLQRKQLLPIELLLQTDRHVHRQTRCHHITG